MKLKLIIAIIFTAICKISYCQSVNDNQKISIYETYIIAGDLPYDEGLQTKYEKDFRLIVWNETLETAYKFTNAEMTKLGYEFVKTNSGDKYQRSKVYRNCKKGIVLEVTEWYGMKLSLAMQWYSQEARGQIGYLIYCK